MRLHPPSATEGRTRVQCRYEYFKVALLSTVTHEGTTCVFPLDIPVLVGADIDRKQASVSWSAAGARFCFELSAVRSELAEFPSPFGHSIQWMQVVHYAMVRVAAALG
jgi:hypothetical protein